MYPHIQYMVKIYGFNTFTESYSSEQLESEHFIFSFIPHTAFRPNYPIYNVPHNPQLSLNMDADSVCSEMDGMKVVQAVDFVQRSTKNVNELLDQH